MITPEQRQKIQQYNQEQGVQTSAQPTNSAMIDRIVSKANTVRQEKKDNSFLSKAKATLGGFASGVGGAVLTAEDYLARKAVGALPDDFSVGGVTKQQMVENLNNAPSLHESFKEEMGGNAHPNLYGGGQLAGEIATLATPVSAAGKITRVGTEALMGEKLATKLPLIPKLVQAGTEGIAFTAGQSLTEGEKMSLKDYAVNAGLNMAVPGLGAAAKKVGETLPGRIVNSLIKPLAKDFAYGKDPGKVVAEMGITGNNFDELITNIKTAKQEVGQEIGNLRKASAVQPTITDSVLTPIDEAISKANKSPRTNAGLITRLEALKADIAQNIKAGASAEEIKSLVGDLTKWTGNATDDQLANKALRETYGSINEEMNKAFKQGLSPEDFARYEKANEQYGSLISAENAAKYRDKILARQDLISFGAKNAGLLTALLTGLTTGGINMTTILAGIGGAAFDKAMATPAFKTRLASLLSKFAPKEVQTFFDKIPTAKTLFKEEELKGLINRIDETPRP